MEFLRRLFVNAGMGKNSAAWIFSQQRRNGAQRDADL
jgi:hypothetical protein